MPPNPPSLVGANHSCKILDPPLNCVAYIQQITHAMVTNCDNKTNRFVDVEMDLGYVLDGNLSQCSLHSKCHKGKGRGCKIIPPLQCKLQNLMLPDLTTKVFDLF